MVIIEKINETYVRISAEESTLKEIDYQFRYHSKDYKFDKRFRAHTWNGYIHLFSTTNHTFLIGILPELVAFLKKSNYEYKIKGKFETEEFSEIEAIDFIKTLNIPDKYEVRDYQLKYFIKGVRNRRMVGISPTASGKSLLMYLFFRYFNKKTLIVVPTIQLVSQMFSDFKDYGYEGDAHLIMEGETRKTDKQLIISTYQSIYDETRTWFDSMKVILGDEVHTFQAKTLKKMMLKTTNTPVKIGVSGTLSTDELSNMTIKGLFGPICKFISTKQLIERGFSSPLYIKILKLKYLNSIYRDNSIKVDYQDEIAYILNLPERIRFLSNLAVSLKGNTFVMIRHKNHGKAIYDEILKKATVPVYYIDGSYSGEERVELIKKIEQHEDSITICSTIFSTGINILRLNNLIFAHPAKSRIRVLQTLGRGLRKMKLKTHLMVFDIADDLIDSVENTTLLHMKERRAIYEEEEFPFQEYNISLK